MKANSLQYYNSAAYFTHLLLILKIHHQIISVAKTVLYLTSSSLDRKIQRSSLHRRSKEYFFYLDPWLYIQILSSTLSRNLVCLCLAVAVDAGMATIPCAWQLWRAESVVEAGSSETGTKRHISPWCRFCPWLNQNTGKVCYNGTENLCCVPGLYVTSTTGQF